VRRDRRLLLAMAGAAGAAAAVLAAFAVGGGLLVWSTLDAQGREALSAALAGRVLLLGMAAVAVIGAAAAAVQPLYRRWIAAAARLREHTRVLVDTDVRRELTCEGASADLAGLADGINALARQRDQLRQDIADKVAEASRGIEQERNRLAALMSELTQSVVVCNLDGRVLLYNNRARMQFRALSDTPALADGAELIGLGRSIYTVFDRKLVAHAVESVQQRLQRGAAHPSAQFVTTTRSGQLLRAQVAPVRGAGGADAGEPPPVTGFVLMLENITRDHEQHSARERMLHGLTEGSRGSLANLQAAVEMLDDDGLEPAMRERFLAVVRDEARTMAGRIDNLAAQNAEGLATRWPLEEMLGADFVQAAARRIEQQAALQVSVGEVDEALWLKLDSFALLMALASLAARLQAEYQVRTVELRLLPGDGKRARLDLVWPGLAMSTETVMTWEMDPMIDIGGGASSLTVRDVVQRHAGEFWFERERTRQRCFFRFLLPLAASTGAEAAAEDYLRTDSRPEFYDFDLFAASESQHALDDRKLSELAYTVFDTETTGLDPAGGDEIIQIGATRLVNGKLLRSESFDQLVDPQRPIPEASIPIHGIRPEMVAGKPIIDAVLPAFHAYARDTVLVAHNAAFDMRFLQLKEQRTGLRFDQPVLDTLLLSAVVQPNQESHRLEAIAERFDIAVIGRHNALGDALVTAEVFLRMIPLLSQMGIHTLGQARAAAQQTYYARLKY
jgi:DNA polymerase-3 subunit epsilon